MKISKVLYLGLPLALMLATMSVYFLASSTNTTIASAQSSVDLIRPHDTARADQLQTALDFRSTHDLDAFGGQGVNDSGTSVMRGVRTNVVSENARADANRALQIINQLPCTDLSESDLAGRAIAAGVYCLPSMNLKGQMTLDAESNSAASFVFIVKGSLDASSAASFSLVRGADAANVYFAVNDGATVAPEVNFAGTIIARDSIKVGSKATVRGRVISVDGKVELNGNTLGNGTGILEICKQQQAPGLEDHIFRFQIGAQIIEVPVGSCSGPIDLAAGSVTINELVDGRTTSGGTFSGRFKLVDVNSPVAGAVQSVDLPTRTARVLVREGDISNQTVVNFVNAFAITGVVEICKRAAPGDPDVTGFFDYTIDAIPNTTFSVPTGFCSQPITVTARTTSQPPPPPPALGLLFITELARPEFQLESITTLPAGRLNQPAIFNLGIVNSIACSNIGTGNPPEECVFSNPGGGIADTIFLEGGVSSQTTVIFTNRSRPGRVKVCKIAGPGIPINTIFHFEVRGTAPSNPFPGPILPGVDVVTNVDVPAGPADQGGFCQFVPGLFVIGTNVLVTELNGLPPEKLAGGSELNTSFVGSDPKTVSVKVVPSSDKSSVNDLGGTQEDQRIASIRSSTGFAPAGTTVQGITVSPNPNLVTGQAIIPVRRSTSEITFANFIFRPTILKICKIAGPGVTVGTPFTFSITVDNEGIFDTSTLTVPDLTVQAGPQSQGGFCRFAQGPYTPTRSDIPVGTFRVGSRVTVTEQAVPNVAVGAVLSPTTPLSQCSPANPRCTILTMVNPDAFNELTYVNVAAVTQGARAIYDFDGDGKSDISIYRPSTGTWWYAASSDNNAQRAIRWGSETDQVAAGDFDGDGKTDPAVYRNGDWFILGTTVGKIAFHFGLPGDIPQVGDYDGDGKADAAVFRPSNRTWYILQSRDGFTAAVFGLSTDKPVAADFDGDGKTDIAVYRDGVWYLLQSSAGFAVVNWGIASDIPIERDYDGDGKADPAVYRNGVWWILKSTGGFTQQGFGAAGNYPAPADYDGDGKADLAYIENGMWHIIYSGGGISTSSGIPFGFTTDVPVIVH